MTKFLFTIGMTEYGPQTVSLVVYSIFICMNEMHYDMLRNINGNSEWNKETNQPTTTEKKRNE